MTTGNKYLDYVLFITLVLVAAIILIRVLRYFLGRFLNRQSTQLKVDATKYHFLKNALSFLIILAALITIFSVIPELKQFGITLFASAGILAAIVGFASQAAFSNIVSGVFIVIFRPFRVGDIINISQQYFGTVEDINLRHTTIRDIENKRYILPNSLISSEVIHNYLIDDEKVCNQICFGVGYDANLDQAMQIIQSEAENHPASIDNRTPEEIEKGQTPVMVRVVEWAESAIQLRASVWSQDPVAGFEMKTQLLKSVKDRFDEEGISIPYPHRTVILKNERPTKG